MVGFSSKSSNWPMLSELGALPAERRAGIDLAVANGWLRRHESVRILPFDPGGYRPFRLSWRT
jgi:hypothetical protein